MKKSYTFRLDQTLINDLDLYDGSRTSNLTKAIRMYVLGESHLHNENNTDEIQYLRDLNSKLLKKIDDKDQQITIMSLSWWQRRKYIKTTKLISAYDE